MTVTSLVQSNIIRSRSSIYKEGKNQREKARKFLAMILIFAMITVMILYVLQVTSIAAKGYEIRGLKKRIAQIEEKNKALQVNISNLKSVNSLQSKTETFNMVKAEEIEYVILSPANVAAK